MKISRIDTSDPRFPRFEQFTNEHPGAHFFQSGDFYRFIDGIDNYIPVLLICEDDRSEIRGSLLAVIQRENNRFLRRLSSAVIVRGGPLADPSGEEQVILSQLVRSLTMIAGKEALFTEFRNFSDQSGNAKIFNDLGFRFHDHQNLVTPTKSREEAWSGMNKSRKRQITVSLKNGASVVTDPAPEEFREFYNLLRQLYRTRIHKPLPPWSFFQRYYDLVKGSSHGIAHVIKYGDRVIGGIICPASKDRVLHEWYVCGLDRQYRGQGVYPSVLATWSAIEHAASNHFEAFDFLGLGNPENPYGVRDFKLKFGGNLVNYGRFKRINNRPLYFIASSGYFVLKKIAGVIPGNRGKL